MTTHSTTHSTTHTTTQAGTDPVRHDRPDLTMYRVVHHAIRDAAHRLVGAVATTDPSDTRRAKAIARYWEGYAGEVLAHHTVEDEVVFPALRDRAPSAVAMTDRTDADHEHLDELMDRCGRAIGHLTVPGARAEAVAALRALAQHMDEHLDFEDAEMLPLVEQAFTHDEYDALEKRALEVVGTGKQAMFTVPFVAASVTPAARAELLAMAPLPMRIVYRLARGSHARLSTQVFGPGSAPAFGGKAVA